MSFRASVRAPPDIFISYEAREAGEVASAIYTALRSRGVMVAHSNADENAAVDTIAALLDCRLVVILGTQGYGSRNLSGFSTCEELCFVVSKGKPALLLDLCEGSAFRDAETQFRLRCPKRTLPTFPWRPERREHGVEVAPFLLQMVLERLQADVTAQQGEIELDGIVVQRGGVLANAEAVRLRRQAELGDPRAQCHIAYCYAEGKDIAYDPDAAATWFQRAAQKWQDAACASTGRKSQGAGAGGVSAWPSVDSGPPLQPDVALKRLVAKVMEDALKNCDPAAQGALARWYAAGRHGVQQSYDKAGRLAWRAAEAGDANGQLALGWLYGNGEGGFRKDEVRALHWFRLAAQQGCTDAAYNLGLYYKLGCGGLAKNEPVAVQWFHRAADEGHVEAAYELASAYRKGWGGLRMDKHAAERWYEFAVARGHERALAKLQRMRRGSGKGLGHMIYGIFGGGSSSRSATARGGSTNAA
jgi:TPR repeat protein